MTTAKTGLLAASLALVAAAVTGCSGGSPTNASVKDFCDQQNSLLTDLADMSGTTQEEALDTIKKWGRDLEKVGTPEEMSDEAREGFELMIAQVEELKKGSTAEDFDKIDDNMSASEKKASAAFEKYAADTCGTPEVPTDVPTPTS